MLSRLYDFLLQVEKALHVAVLGDHPDQDLQVLLAPVALQLLRLYHPKWRRAYLSMRTYVFLKSSSGVEMLSVNLSGFLWAPQ